ncbi:MAG: insulinase family protein [Chloroflexi bacterium]|nr:insulinase family protein [Chloroflexota bacterium]
MSATVDPEVQPVVLADRPEPGAPRSYDFPDITERQLPNGLTIRIADMPGRPLVSAVMVIAAGVADEPPELAGATVLAARALTEGTEQYDAISLIEAAERLGASLHAESGWDALSVGVDVPAARLAPALELVAEMLLRPTFPEPEVERLRDERLNDLLQVQADPRRRVEVAFVDTIYAAESPYHRPSGGTRETVEGLTAADLRRVYDRILDPRRATLVIGGDLGGVDVVALVERLFGAWRSSAATGDIAPGGAPIDTGSTTGRVIRVVHRSGSVQTEIRIGHRGLPRQIDDFHAVSVMGAILGGLFNSRLNMKLREEKGYTYGAGAGFDMRRGAGPFAARAAVNTEVTVPAILDTLAELNRIRDVPVTDSELAAARDFLIGVFPLRFETAGAVVGALGSLAVHGLPVEELVGYRSRIEAVDIDAISAAARTHLHVDDAAIVLVGDADAFGPALEVAELGQIIIERDAPQPGIGPQEDAALVGPIDDDEAEGPSAGAEDTDLAAADDGPDDPGETVSPIVG